MHYYSRNIGDYLKDTNGLSLIEHGAYGLLLDWAYANEKPLPLEAERLHRICCAVTKHDRLAVKAVLEQFWTLEKDGWTHKRVIKEIRKYYNKKESGTANVGKRWHQTDTNDDTNEHTKSIANEQATITRVSRTKNQEPRTISSAASPPELMLEAESTIPETPPSDSRPNTDAHEESDSAKKKKEAGARAMAPKGGRERNALFDALVLLTGTPLDQVTKALGGEVAAALRDIREVMPEVTAEEINRRGAAYRAKWPKITLSPSALAKHWGSLAPAQKKEEGEASASREPDWDWRAVSAGIYGEAVTVPWNVMLPRMREEIVMQYKLENLERTPRA